MIVALLRARRLSVAAAMLLVAYPRASAQDWTFGVNGGAAQGGFSGSPEFNWSHFAPSGSVFLTQPFAKGFWLQPELGYSRKVGVSNTPISKLTLSADYLELPLLFQYRWRGSAPVNPFLQVGPGVTIRMRCTLAFEGSGVSTRDDCDVVRGESSQKVDATIIGGVGIATIVAGTRLTLEGRAQTGLLASAAPVDATNPRSFGWSVLFGVSRVLRGSSGPSVPLPGPGSPMAGQAGAPVANGSEAAHGIQVAGASLITADSNRLVPAGNTTDPLAAISSRRLLTVHATNADTRALLVAVARVAGLDLVINGDVRTRASVALTDVSAADAIRAIVASAGLAISGPATNRAATSLVFYRPSVNDPGSSMTIGARSGTSAELETFIYWVDNWPRRPKR